VFKPAKPVTIMETACDVIEELAMLNGIYTDEYQRKAEEKAQKGDKYMIQAIKSGEVLRKNLTNLLKL
jgi:hypothetical protein